MLGINGLHFHCLLTEFNKEYMFLFLHNIQLIPYIVGHGYPFVGQYLLLNPWMKIGEVDTDLEV
jgi:hypothetical protein